MALVINNQTNYVMLILHKDFNHKNSKIMVNILYRRSNERIEEYISHCISHQYIFGKSHSFKKYQSIHD